MAANKKRRATTLLATAALYGGELVIPVTVLEQPPLD